MLSHYHYPNEKLNLDNFDNKLTNIQNCYVKAMLHGAIFFCNLQCNSTLETCKIAKYESSLHSANVFSTYRKFFTDFTN